MSDGDQWTLMTAEDDSEPAIFRVRARPPAFVSKKKFKHLLAVVWQYRSRNDSGMPKETAIEHMDQLEDLLMEALENAKAAFLSAIATGSGVREWQFHLRDPEHVMEIVNKTLGKLEPFPVSFHFDDDPDWEAYESLRSSHQS